MGVRAIRLARSMVLGAVALGGCTFGSLSGGGGSVTIGGDDDGATESTSGPGAGPIGDDSDAEATGGGSGSDGADATGGCPPGSEGCPCDGRACEAGLVCAKGSCVAATCGNDVLDRGELCDDGNLQFGDGCDACEPSPGVKGIVAGERHTCALLFSGGVRCWGEGADGRLGYGDAERVGDTEHPWEKGDVPLGGAAVALSAGGNFTCALLDDATVRCWGDHAAGRLGNKADSAIGDDEPASDSPVVELGGDAVQIACGRAHCCAVRSDNSLVCWGEGGQGRLGYGNQDDVGLSSDPADAGPVMLGGDVKQVAAGGAHTCAVLVNDDLLCWGDGGHGRLGYGDNVTIGAAEDALPAMVGRVPLGAAVQSVRAGATHTCALLLGGAVRCWGQNNAGQCGIAGGGSIGDSMDELPGDLDDLPLGQPTVSIGLGVQHSCAVLEDGTVRCWGEGDHGRLGYGATTDVYVPLGEPVPISADQLVVRIAAGGEHTCGLLDLGNVRCWGHGDVGALGYASTASIADTPDTSAEQAGDVQVLQP